MTVLVGLRAINGVTMASAVPAVLPVHEEVEHQARKEEQVGESPEDVCPVLRDKEECSNGNEGDQHPTRSRAEPPV